MRTFTFGQTKSEPEPEKQEIHVEECDEKKQSHQSKILKIIFAIFIYLLTFPAIEPDLAPGLDASYVWGLNWLFANDYSTLSQHVYPIGPLALLKLPALEGGNFIIFLIVYSLLKFWFIFECFRLSESYSRNFYLASVLILVASYFANVDLLINFLCLILCLRSIKKSKWIFFVLASMLAFVGLFVKTSIGLTSLSVLFVAWIVDFYENRSWKRVFANAFSVLFSALIVGLVVLHSFSALVEYFIAEFHLVTGYGGALSLHPDNNWIALAIFIATMLTFPFFSKEKDSRYIFLLALIPLFASWKHAVVREDITHYQSIISFVIVFWCVLLATKTKRKNYTIICALLSVMMLYCNMKEIPGYNGRRVEYCGVNNFNGIVFGYKDFSAKMNALTDDALACEKLPDEVLKMIDSSSIDFYPWEHTYAKVNNLNWQPRKTVEIGASTSKWLSDLAAENYCGDTRADFILWHFCDDGFTIDGRYPLNDEPNVVFNILQNYSPVFYGEKYVLFKRNEGKITRNCGEKFTAKFDEWIKVPDCGDAIQRVKVESSVTFAGFLKKTFLKDEMYYVDYMTADDEVYTYRYVPSTALDGLWINPFVTKFIDGELAEKIVMVRFRNSSKSCVDENISLQFETLGAQLGNLVKTYKGNFKSLYVNNFENMTERITDEFAYSGAYSNKVEHDNYSYTYAIAMDSLWSMVADSCDLNLRATCRFLNKDASSLVVSIDGNEEIFYQSTSFEKTDNVYWMKANVDCRVEREKFPHGLLKVYVWNNGEEPTYVDDLKVSECSLCR